MPQPTLRQLNAEFREHWWDYVLLFTGMGISLEVIFIPFFRLLATYLLHLGEVPIFTLTNITMLLTQHPIVSLALAGELILILIVGYWQFAFLLLGILASAKQSAIRFLLSVTCAQLPSWFFWDMFSCCSQELV